MLGVGVATWKLPMGNPEKKSCIVFLSSTYVDLLHG